MWCKKKLDTFKVLTDNKTDIALLEWKHVPRQGKTKSGNLRTQLELTRSVLPVEVVLAKLVEQAEVCRLHQAQYQWINHARKLDFVMSNSSNTRVTATDFGAMLSLYASKKDNCSVDNHAVVCIFFVLSDWRVVQYKSNSNEEDETIINDCDKWIFSETH